MSLQESRNASRTSSARKNRTPRKILVPGTLVRPTRYFRLPVFCPIVQLFRLCCVRQTESLERQTWDTNLGLGACTIREAAFARSAHPARNHSGDNMTNRLGVLFLLAGAAVASPAFAGDSATMKCNATQDRVWVYDSLTSFDVSAKLKCGETVEITGRVKGYVKIHAANGVEGYVPDSTFPNLPPFVDPNDQQPSVSIAKRVAPRAAAQPAAAAPAPAAAVSSPAPTATPATSALPLNASKITISPANSVAQVQPSANSAPASTAVVRTVAESAPTPVTVPSAPATTMAVTGVTSAKSSSPSSAKKPNPAPAATAKSQPVPPPAAQPAAPPPAPHAPALTSTSATVSSKSSSPASAGKTANNK